MLVGRHGAAVLARDDRDEDHRGDAHRERDPADGVRDAPPERDARDRKQRRERSDRELPTDLRIGRVAARPVRGVARLRSLRRDLAHLVDGIDHEDAAEPAVALFEHGRRQREPGRRRDDDRRQRHPAGRVAPAPGRRGDGDEGERERREVAGMPVAEQRVRALDRRQQALVVAGADIAADAHGEPRERSGDRDRQTAAAPAHTSGVRRLQPAGRHESSVGTWTTS